MQYFNEAHYPDPTAGEAMRNIEKRENAYLPLIYICSAYRNNPGLSHINHVRQLFSCTQKASTLAKGRRLV